MMFTPEELIVKINEVVLGKRHKDYKYVVDLNDTYTKLFTGEGIETMLKQFAIRESDEMFTQRKTIYQSVMPSVANNIENVFKKVFRSPRTFSSIGEPGNSAEDVKEAAHKFWFGESDSGVDAWMRTRWFDLVVLDPNAHLAVEFAPFDPNIEKAQPYPTEYSATDSLNFFYDAGDLKWFIGQKDCVYMKVGKLEQGKAFYAYIPNFIIVYTPVDFDKPDFTSFVGDYSIKVFDDKRIKYAVQIFETKSEKLPVTRVGVFGDRITKSRTCVSILHSALPFFKKELKAGSEFDLTIALHTFPQKVQIGKRCEGDRKNNQVCRGGLTSSGTTCPVCNGTGLQPVHKTAQDIILIAPPARPEDPWPDVEKFLTYKFPPIDLIKFQNDYVDSLTEKARKAVFGGTSFTQKEGDVKTATEVGFAMEETYDALYPFSQKYTSMWLFTMEIIAIYVDAPTTKLYHRIEYDLKLKTLVELYKERQTAVVAKVPDIILAAIDEDIMCIQYRDDQDTLFKLKVKNQFMPFKGKSNEEVSNIVTRGSAKKSDIILYDNFENIFSSIEQDVGDVFYVWDPKKQKIEIDKRVQDIIEDTAVDKIALSGIDNLIEQE